MIIGHPLACGSDDTGTFRKPRAHTAGASRPGVLSTAALDGWHRSANGNIVPPYRTTDVKIKGVREENP